MAIFENAQIVAITGRAGHGKDTFYRSVLAPLGFERIGLADPLKGGLLARDATGLVFATTAQVVERIAKRYYEFMGAVKSPETRADLQRIGTDEIREGFDPCILSVVAMKEIRARVMAGARVAITDVRFPDEAWVVQGAKAQLESMYKARDVEGKPSDPATRWAATHFWDDHSEKFRCFGALPIKELYPRYGQLLMGATLREHVRTAVIRVSRPEAVLTGEAAAHASETRGDAITPDVSIHASSVTELALEGRKHFGVPEWERQAQASESATEFIHRVGVPEPVAVVSSGLNRFWMVMAERKPGAMPSSEPRVQHKSLIVARAEATRLASLHAPTKFFVLEMVGAAQASSVMYTAADPA